MQSQGPLIAGERPGFAMDAGAYMDAGPNLVAGPKVPIVFFLLLSSPRNENIWTVWIGIALIVSSLRIAAGRAGPGWAGLRTGRSIRPASNHRLVGGEWSEARQPATSEPTST